MPDSDRRSSTEPLSLPCTSGRARQLRTTSTNKLSPAGKNMSIAGNPPSVCTCVRSIYKVSSLPTRYQR
jgi:hypothetical protein